MRLKKEVFLAKNVPETRGRYQEDRRTTASAVTKDKTWMWEVFKGALEKDFCLASSSSKQSVNSERGNRGWLRLYSHTGTVNSE